MAKQVNVVFSEANEQRLQSVRVDVVREKRQLTHDPQPEPKVSYTSDRAYVNSAFVGSVNSVNDSRVQRTEPPITGVVREQYWACSKWPSSQRMLALAVGLLLGTVFGLSLTVALRDHDGGGNFIDNLLRNSVN